MNAQPFLSGLGILDTDQVCNPTAASFPAAFNISCQPIWNAIISSTIFKEDVGYNWGLSIKLFIEICVTEGKYPFSNLRQADNDQILQCLIDARRAVVKFLDRSHMLDYVSVRATRREVEMNNLGFVLKVFGNVILKDPTFEKWLLQMPYPRFNINKEHGRYIKHLSHNITMVVYNEGASLSQRWHIGYEIVCHQFPDLPGKHLASKAELEKFILDILWMPVLKSHRPQGFHRRLI